MRFRYTLVSEGSSDALLLRIIDWVWRQQPGLEPTGQFFDPGSLRRCPSALTSKLPLALKYFPCEVLFVHRDSDARPWSERRREILQAAEGVVDPVVPVIPVRATEAWLLFDEAAIRRAAGNPNGRQDLDLPQLTDCEQLADPKRVLFEALRQASGLSGRRLKRFSPHRTRVRIAELLDDYSPLQALSAFRAFMDDVGKAGQCLLEGRTAPGLTEA